MGIPNVEVNLIAVLAASVATMIIGALWYSPLLFGNLWIKLTGMSKEKINKMKKEGKVGRSYFWAFIASIVSMCVLSLFVRYAGASSFGDGLIIGFYAWLGFMVPLSLNNVLWGGDSIKLFFLNAAHHLVAACIGAGILAVLV